MFPDREGNQANLAELDQEHYAFVPDSVDIVCAIAGLKFHMCTHEINDVAVANEMFDRLVGDIILIMAKLVDDEGFEEMCIWNVTLAHTTHQCHAFRGFVAKQLERNKIKFSPEESQSLEIDEFLVEHQKVIHKGKEFELKERTETYKDALETLPLQATSIVELKRLNNRLCPQCADMLHCEMVRIHIIPNDPKWVQSYHTTSYLKRSRYPVQWNSSKTRRRGGRGQSISRNPPPSHRLILSSGKQVTLPGILEAEETLQAKIRQESLV